MKTVFLCKSGLDGIFCGVYDVYASGLPLDECRLELEEEYEPELFCQYRTVALDEEKAGKVSEKIYSRMTREAYLWIYRASLHRSPSRADCILQFIRLGLKEGKRIVTMMQSPEVFEVFQMNRYVGNEAHFLREFIRFQRTKSGIFMGKVGPENDVLELAAEHFSDRFPDMDWILYDEKRRKAAFHEGRTGQWAMCLDVSESALKALTEKKPMPGPKAEIAPYPTAGRNAEADQDSYAELWKTFFRSISIEERKNPKLQRNLLPLRYRGYMTEFM